MTKLSTQHSSSAAADRVELQVGHSVRTTASLVLTCVLVALALPAGASAQAPGWEIDKRPSGIDVDKATPGTVEGGGGATSVDFTRDGCEKAKKKAVKKAKKKVKKAKKKVKKAKRKEAKKKAREKLKKARQKLKKAKGRKCKTLESRLPRAAQESERRVPLPLRKLDSGFATGKAPQVGRFYTDGDTADPYGGWCSGTLIARGLVLTAAHCLYDNDDSGTVRTAHPNGYYSSYDRMVFVPGNTVGANGKWSAPYGVWNVDRAVVPNGWTGASGSFTGGLDWGLVTLQPINGKYPGDYVGDYDSYADVRFGVGTRFWSLGYPAVGAFAQAKYAFGSWLYFCDNIWEGTAYNNLSAATNPVFDGGYWLIYKSCEMNGGSSGGPVFVRFTDGTWGIVAVNNRATSPNGVGDEMYKSWFSRKYGEFYSSAITTLRSPAKARSSSNHNAASAATWSGAAPTDAVSPGLSSGGPDEPSLGSADRKPPPPPG